MWNDIQIIVLFIIIFIYALSIVILPYLLAGVGIKLIIPKVKSNLIAILATLLMAFLTQNYHLIGNFDFPTNFIQEDFYRLAKLEKAGFHFYSRFLLALIPNLIGWLFFPYCFARLGVFIVDKIKKRKNTNN